MLKVFKITAILDGVSFLVLIANMLILKTYNPELYHVILQSFGMAHGFLFIAYIVLALLLKKQQNWSYPTLGIIMGASLIPFGTFYIEKKYCKNV